MAGGGGSIESGEPEFQVAPMIDVLLTILVFFMSITSMEVLKVDQDIPLPVAPDAKKAEKQRGEIILNIRWDVAKKKATYFLDQKAYARLADLTPEMVKAVAVAKTGIREGWNPNVRMIIRASKELPASEVSLVMNAGAEAGIADIAFSAASKE